MEDCRSVVSLPESFCRLSNLKKLNLGSSDYYNPMKLESLPERFGEQLVNLTDFNLHGCVKLQELPESICNMRSLTKLDLSGDGGGFGACGPMSIRALPERFGQLRNLVQLDLSYTEMKELPEGIPA